MKLEKKVMAAKVKEWRDILQIDPQWDITFEIIDNPLNMSDDCEGSMACIGVDLDYFSAHIEFNSVEISKDDLDYIVLHELLHILMEPISQAASQGLGKKFEKIGITFCESTVERLIPGYLKLYGKINGVKINGKTGAKKKKVCSFKRVKRKV